MRRLIPIIIAVSLAGGALAGGPVDRIYEYFRDGDITRARAEFQDLPQSAARDGNRLFVSGLLEPSGEMARDLLSAAVRSDLDGKYQEEAHFRMLQLAEAAGDTSTVLSVGAAFLDRWEMSRYRERILAMLAAHAADGGAEQERFLHLLAGESPGSYYGLFAVLTRATADMRAQRYDNIAEMSGDIIDSGDDNIIPSGLILLARAAIAQGNTERALLNYNILREKFPHAVGQEELLRELKDDSDRRSGEGSTEIFEGVAYTIQVGVFAKKDNAERMKKRIEAYGYKSRISKRSVSGNTYHFVLSGRFTTLKEARVAKEKLEMGENEVFKVVIDDEK